MNNSFIDFGRYQPSSIQILCHNIVAAYNGETFLIDVIAAEEQTNLFFIHVFGGLANTLGIDTHNKPLNELVGLLVVDAFDVLAAAKKIAYRRVSARLDPIATSPYANFDHNTLRTFVSQSDATLSHFVGTFGKSADAALSPSKIKRSLFSYFNMRYATAIFLIEGFPLSGNENIHFINREQYYNSLDEDGSDVVV